MPNLNKVMLMGNLTRDPEVKYTPKGTAIAQIGIAVNRTFPDSAGQKREEVTFIDVEAFGKTAESLGEYFKKGMPIFVEGRLRLDSWDDKQSGQKRSKLKVSMESFQFLSSRGENGASPQQDRAPEEDRTPAPQQTPARGKDADLAPDEIPF
jgi:single-strand DNA-binding protein